jgi:hypothetical protein
MALEKMNVEAVGMSLVGTPGKFPVNLKLASVENFGLFDL